jgi:hypothetical protein
MRAVVQIDEIYTREKIIAALASHLPDCEIVDGDGDGEDAKLHWREYEQLPWDRVADRSVVANAYCIRKALIRKSQLAFIVRKFVTKYPASSLAFAVPETHLLDVDHPDYLDEALNDAYEVVDALRENQELVSRGEAPLHRFLLKASMTNKGAGIFLIESEQQIYDIFAHMNDDDDESDDEGDVLEDGDSATGKSIDTSTVVSSTSMQLRFVREWVIQRFIDRPLLLPACLDRKFHLRVYVLAVGAVRVYVYDQILALFAHRPYDTNDRLAYLTNTCLQTDQPDFDEDLSVRLFWSLPVDDTSRLHDAFGQVKTILADLFEAAVGEVTAFQPLENCFELFGMDFMIDQDWRVHFLEANAFPGRVIR